jgi:hypothetical protein
VLVAKLTRPGFNRVNVLVVGIRLGLQFSMPDDKPVNANGEMFCEATRNLLVQLAMAKSDTAI